MSQNKPLVTFLKAADNPSKLSKICDIIHRHFDKKCAILVSVPNADAAKYLDELFWRLPEEGFMPHIVTNMQTTETVVITTETKNPNQAKVLFNLCPGISPNSADFEAIYDLYDETHPGKTELSEQRLKAYRSCGFTVSVV